MWLVEQGSDISFDNLPGVGNILFLGDGIRLCRRAAGDANAAVFRLRAVDTGDPC